MQYSIVTLTHNKLAYTRRCLGSLLGSAGEWELVVVDNGSTDGTVEWLEAFRTEAAGHGVTVTVIRNARNIGCSTARNQGTEAARAPRVVYIDNDVALRSRHWLEHMGGVLDREPDVAMVGPKLVYPFPPFDIQCAGVAISRTGRVLFRGRGEPGAAPGFNERRDVQCLISACCMARTELVREAGGFDEAFNPVEFEDFDLCYRLRARGHRIVYDPGAEMYHFESVTTAGTRALPNTALIIRHGLLFKERWRHMFEKEDGPPDDDTQWKSIRTPHLEEIRETPIVE